jgi:HK97 family phage major capsid protein
MDMELQPAPETKGAGENALELKESLDDFLSAFEAFKDANDERLDQIERKLGSDVVTEEKVARINQALETQKRTLDRLVLKGRRPELGPSTSSGRGAGEVSEHKAAFDAYFRSGEASGLKRLEAKALQAGVDADGGYLVPEETEAEIGRRLNVVSPIRAIAGIRTVSSNFYRKPFATSGFATGWVGETDARPETATPTLAELEYPVMEIYAMPAATQTLLDDAAVDIDKWIAGEVEMAFAEQETAAFVHGDAVKKPRGFLNYPVAAEGAWSWGTLGYVATGVSGDFAATDESDVLVDLIYALKAGYRQNDANSHLRLRSYTVATLPDPAAAAGQMIFCSDLGGGGGQLTSDGAAWRRVSGGGQQTIATNAAATLAVLTNAEGILHTRECSPQTGR